MAEAKDELDLDAKQPPPPGKKRLILMIFGALLLVGASVGGTLLLIGGGADEPAKEAVEKARPVPRYLPLETMVVNFGERGPARYLQVELQVMAHDPAVLGAIETHMPVIRNNILMLLGSQKFETVSTREGKEKLRADILQSVNDVLRQQAEMEEGIQAVYFTSFVMQ